MPTNTYVALRTEVLTSATPSVTFNLSGITGYTDLVMVYAPLGSTNTVTHSMRINGDTASNYSLTGMRGDGSSATSYRASNQTSLVMYPNDYDNTTIPGVFIVNFPNYANNTTFKTILWRAGLSAGGQGVSAQVGLWRKTPEAITSITLTSSGNFAAGSTFTIYGIAAASVGAKATGGTIYTDSQYYYHVFAGNGTFTPTQSITADCLVVAGGGGGGSNGGAGGAGGLLGFTGQSLTATNYTVTVGGGGAVNTVGVDSQFGGLTLVKGGGRGGSDSAGGNGGSGGSASAGGLSGGTATSGQGYNGGVGSGTIGVTEVAGGGGGGAGAVGSNASSNDIAGNGGIGSAAYSSWGLATGTGQNVNGTYYYAGGGGGSFSIGTFGGSWTSGTRGLGGLGGGGNGGTGAANAAGGNATANTGGGGGAGKWSSAGSLGGSGIVIVRYAK